MRVYARVHMHACKAGPLVCVHACVCVCVCARVHMHACKSGPPTDHTDHTQPLISLPKKKEKKSNETCSSFSDLSHHPTLI